MCQFESTLWENPSRQQVFKKFTANTFKRQKKFFGVVQQKEKIADAKTAAIFSCNTPCKINSHLVWVSVNSSP